MWRVQGMWEVKAPHTFYFNIESDDNFDDEY